jgi:MFS family permease
MLFAARALMGLGSGGLWIGVSFATPAYWPGQQYLCMSRIYAAYSAGALLGPALGALGGTCPTPPTAPRRPAPPRTPRTSFGEDSGDAGFLGSRARAGLAGAWRQHPLGLRFSGTIGSSRVKRSIKIADEVSIVSMPTVSRTKSSGGTRLDPRVERCAVRTGASIAVSASLSEKASRNSFVISQMRAALRRPLSCRGCIRPCRVA